MKKTILIFSLFFFIITHTTITTSFAAVCCDSISYCPDPVCFLESSSCGSYYDCCALGYTTSCVNAGCPCPSPDIFISSCSNLNQAGKTYYLTQNIINSGAGVCMNISANNITLDCQGYTIDGTDASNTYGIYINRSSIEVTNIIIKNCILTDWTYGIYLNKVENNTFINNTANSNSDYGFYLSSSSSNTFINNTASSNYRGFYLDSSHNNTFINNTANSNSDYGFYLSSSSSNTFINNTASSNSLNGFYLSSSSSNTFINNSITAYHNSTHKQQGLFVTGSSVSHFYNNISESNTINGKPILYQDSYYKPCSNNTIFTNGSSYSYMGFVNCFNITVKDSSPSDGILLAGTKNSTIANLNISFSRIGFYLAAGANYNTFINNTVSSNYRGFYLDSSHNNTITSSIIQANSNYGIYISSSANNTIYNNFFNNTYNFYFSGTIYTNYWNTTKQLGQRIYSPGDYIGGNYWTNPNGNGFSDTCTDADDDGFCDNYYELNSTGPERDYLPLAKGLTISSCSNLNQAGKTYYLTQNIINSGAGVCMNISANNITLDCQGYTIDGTDASNTYGIYINAVPSVTVKNCVLTDWYSGIWVSGNFQSKYNKIFNSTIDSNYYGVFLDETAYNQIISVKFNNNEYGLVSNPSGGDKIINSSFKNNSYGIRLSASSSDEIQRNIISDSRIYGIIFDYSSGNLIFNNLFNNTNNFQFVGTHANYWNTTYSNGGGNYWTNPNGNGFSDTCTDADDDGFCDNYYELNSTGPERDYLPLKYYCFDYYQDGDVSSIACKCLFGQWFSSQSKCCGDDGSSDFFENSGSGNSACVQGEKVSHDSISSTNTSYLVFNGELFYCKEVGGPNSEYSFVTSVNPGTAIGSWKCAYGVWSSGVRIGLRGGRITIIP